MSARAHPSLAELQIADPPDRWRALGFTLDQQDGTDLGAVRIQLGVPGSGITAWAIRGIDPETTAIDGLPTTPAPPHPTPPQPASHPNTARGIDDVVIATPDFDRTAQALGQAGIPLRRVRDAGTFRQGFRRLGPAILELVEAPRPPVPGAPFMDPEPKPRLDPTWSI